MLTTIIRCAIVAAFALNTAGAANGGKVVACSDWETAVKAHHEASTQETRTALAAAERAVLRTVKNKDAAETIKQLRVAADAAHGAMQSSVLWAAQLPGDEKVSKRARDAWIATIWARDSALMNYCPYR